MNDNKTLLIKINTINAHYREIKQICIFPSGNIISISGDQYIKIWNQNFELLQLIYYKSNDILAYIDIKDENNFVTCDWGKIIKIWRKNNINSYTCIETIENAHKDAIWKLIYCKNGNIISCSWDRTIKIWEENNKNKYQCVCILVHQKLLLSILLLKNNILISSGLKGTFFWNINNLECYFYLNDIYCLGRNALCLFDDNKIIIGGKEDYIMKIVSLKEKKIIKEINNFFICWTICIIKDKNVFLTGGKSQNINIFKYNNYELVQIIKYCHDDNINGIIELKDKSIISYSIDKKINIWLLNE